MQLSVYTIITAHNYLCTEWLMHRITCVKDKAKKTCVQDNLMQTICVHNN